jgi:hypothetical protein
MNRCTKHYLGNEEKSFKKVLSMYDRASFNKVKAEPTDATIIRCVFL